MNDHIKQITSIKINDHHLITAGKDGLMNIYSIDQILNINLEKGKIINHTSFKVVYKHFVAIDSSMDGT